MILNDINIVLMLTELLSYLKSLIFYPYCLFLRPNLQKKKFEKFGLPGHVSRHKASPYHQETPHSGETGAVNVGRSE